MKSATKSANLLPGGKIGNKGGTGRPPDWFKSKCEEIIEKKKLIEWLGDVASGCDVDQQVNQNGECLKIPASVKDRLKALEMLQDRAWGKPQQNVDMAVRTEISGEDMDFIKNTIREFTNAK